MATKPISIRDPKIDAILKLRGRPINADHPISKSVRKCLKNCEEYVRLVSGLKRPSYILFLINTDEDNRGYFTRMYRGLPRFSLKARRVYKTRRAAERRQEMLANDFAKVATVLMI